MCGIVGAVGNTKCNWYFDSRAWKLECGYDVIFVLGGAKGNHLVKAAGRIAELSAKNCRCWEIGTYSLGYLRKPTEDNAHPHRPETGRFAWSTTGDWKLPWNKRRIPAGHHRGQTDTEIAVRLIKNRWRNIGLSVLEAFKSPSHHSWFLYLALVDSG